MGRLPFCNGVRIVDLARAHAGAIGSQILGDLGAEIIKIESPYIGDDSRVNAPWLDEGMSYYFLALNRNKKGIVLDLMTPSGKKAFFDLVRVSDVVYDNFRPEILDRLGISYQAVASVNPSIISCSVHGYGSSGPLSNQPIWDDVAAAISGIYSLSGEPGGTPMRSPVAVADIATGMYAALGILACLYERSRTSKGRRIQVNMLDTCLALLQTFFQKYFMTNEPPKAQGSKHATVPFVGAFATKDGYIGLGPCWPRIARIVNREYLIEDPRFATVEGRSKNKVALESLIEEALKEQNSDFWVEVLRAEDIAVAKVNNLAEALEEPQIIHNNPVVRLSYRGKQEIKVIDCPIKMVNGNYDKHTAPPRLGEYSSVVFKEILGYSDEEISQIRSEQEQHLDELKQHIRHLR